MNMVDIILYFRNAMNKEQKRNIIETLRCTEGVIAPRFVPGKEKLLVIAYDSDKTSSSSFKNKMDKMGHGTVIVGM